MLMPVETRFWDVRFDKPLHRSVKQADAIAAVMVQWPDAMIWQVNNHGRECFVLIAE